VNQRGETLVARELCGKWMPRKKSACARRSGHLGDCRTVAALADSRTRKTERRRGSRISVDPAVNRRRRQAYKLLRYSLTHELFNRLLAAQENACGMCRTPFADGQPIFIDHHHGCCRAEKTSCGTCVRGLLCLSCNTALGHIERKYDLARAYLDSPPAQLVMRRELGA
jgi:Recombination endonuclease VII